MASEKTMNRLIHSAVRRDLSRIEQGLGDLQEGDRTRGHQIQATWDNLRHQLTRHHEGEDRYVWPWLESVGIDEKVLAAMESEHANLAASLGESDVAVGTACASGVADQAGSAAGKVASTRAVVDQHFAHEEDELEPLMRPHMDSPQWKAVEKNLRSVSPRTAGWFFAWVQDGATDDELAYLRSVIPGPVLCVLSKGFGRGYGKRVAAAWA